MFYISLTVTTKEILILHLQKIKRQKAEHTTMENDQFIKISRKRRGRKPMGTIKQT